ncbi:LOW QUALITY PROTEIN: hypothetical protein OSB04_028478 [Centaurea solstitialis]|uniref:F-box associated beta-propeller type 1 domain-containing protein n=1 Tax=Centaurea solstitialis TaxID=347529 RepID=A0AA38VXS2_9ASTR|nr:LOW QUALITY PROTEIN: hypothetical protein OSB04_028478 [Centaurea solstitialis]
MKSTAKHSNILLDDDDIMLFEILPRLPLRSLGLCLQAMALVANNACVYQDAPPPSKQSNHPKQLLVPTTKPYKYFRTMDCETPEAGLSANRPIPFRANEMSVISSLNGVVCVGILSSQVGGEEKYSNIILWNPLTGDYKTLPKDDNSHANAFTIPAIGYGFYYSCCDNDYKLLRVTQSGDAYIYSLNSDSWRKVKSTSCCLFEDWCLSCLLNENLCFLVQGKSQTGKWSCLIIRFNTKTDKFTEIAAPPFQYTTVGPSLTVVRGRVHFIESWYRLVVWKMEGDGEWTKVGFYWDEPYNLVFSQALHLMKNGNWLMGSEVRGYVHKVDIEMKTEKEVRVYNTATDGFMDILRRGKFVETIVSLKR